MAREPSYPEDSPVGGSGGGTGDDSASGQPPEQGRASEAAEAAAAAKASDPKRARHLVTGAAIGIGSAALVAALLYANRSRKSERDD